MRRRNFQRPSLPSYNPNLELPKIFSPEDQLFQPTNFASLSSSTKSAFRELVEYQNNEHQLTAKTYQFIAPLLTEIEDAHIQVKLEYIRLLNKRLERHQSSFHDYKLFMDVAKEMPPEASEGDYVLLRTMEDVKYEEDKDYRLSITRVNETYLEVRTSEHCRNRLEATNYEVRFRKDRTVFRFEQHALNSLPSAVIENVLFPKKCGLPADPNAMKFEWCSNSVKTNPEQQQAVRNIVNGSAYPAPYILFGPPGTGKTTTLVETIAQIRKVKPEANILVCASSNYACNEIMSRLLDLNVVDETDMFRYLSKSQMRKLDTIEDRILELSNIDKNQMFNIPTKEDLQGYKIIFLTLVTAGRLHLLEMGTNWFDYIIVDEAGSATEASTVIPIAGFVSVSSYLKHKRNHVVLAGDPKQLGPVICHRSAEKLMYGRSMLDRLMELELYKPDEKSKRYNAACLTKLLQNFRSHKNILDIPNKLFYDNELLAMAKPAITDICLHQQILPNKKVPIIFHSVYGETLKEDDNPSLFNLEECKVVLNYIRKVLLMTCPNGEKIEPKEIGVISPYRRQCVELTKIIRKTLKLYDIEVGSVEQFQGQERKVIILSTVRSNTETIGFLSNPKRLNVSITRAKALLIIVGNPITLQLDNKWHKLIKYCVEQKACKGGFVPLKKHVRGRFKDKRKSSAQKALNDQLKQLTLEKLPESAPKKTILHHKAPTPSTSSGCTSASFTDDNTDDETTADLVSDSELDDIQVDINVLTDDEEIAIPCFNASEDVLTTDDEDEIDESTNNNDETITAEPKNDTNDIFAAEFEFHIDSFGFAQ
ncbi:putative helicase mov-10-B.1 [Culicoides brevitarsis]|uniref:putative helicase mov-10-B.1 n=1 Tax=Culicoides brevitarsis TaxID=469753 RepID=UPI00307B92B8